MPLRLLSPPSLQRRARSISHSRVVSASKATRTATTTADIGADSPGTGLHPLLGDRCIFGGVLRVHLGHIGPGNAADRFPLRERLGQLDLERIDTGDVMCQNADGAAVGQHPVFPLCLAQSLREGGQCIGPLFDSLGEGVGALDHESLLGLNWRLTVNGE